MQGNKLFSINQRLQRIARRAERVEEKILEETFVGIAGIDNIIHNPENQIITGRRGTGKTHAIKFLQRRANATGQIGIFIDLRLLGSEGSLYSTPTVPITERLSKLVTDFFTALHDGLYEIATNPDNPLNIGHIGPDLDRLADALSRIFVETSSEEATSDAYELENSRKRGSDIKLAPAGIAVTASASDNSKTKRSNKIDVKRQGRRLLVVHFATIAKALRELIASANKRTWVFVDEWSSIPEELQPYLADVIRRILFPITQVTIIIGAIEHRSQFQIHRGAGYVGMEIGADCATSINLDDFMVFDNNPKRARDFFSKMIFRHFGSVQAPDLAPVVVDTPQKLIQDAFTQKTFDELIRAAEGVPATP